jgi:hypothetical protein
MLLLGGVLRLEVFRARRNILSRTLGPFLVLNSSRNLWDIPSAPRIQILCLGSFQAPSGGWIRPERVGYVLW